MFTLLWFIYFLILIKKIPLDDKIIMIFNKSYRIIHSKLTYSPEVATRSAHGLEADIWGLGCLLYTLLVGTPPFDTTGVKSTLTKVVMSDYVLPENLSYEARDLINAMLRKNPMERIKLQVQFFVL